MDSSFLSGVGKTQELSAIFVYVQVACQFMVLCIVSWFRVAECKHAGFYCFRNQVMRKKLILFFKRRNHARKQRVSVTVTVTLDKSVSVLPSREFTDVAEKLNYDSNENHLRQNLEVEAFCPLLFGFLLLF